MATGGASLAGSFWEVDTKTISLPPTPSLRSCSPTSTSEAGGDSGCGEKD